MRRFAVLVGFLWVLPVLSGVEDLELIRTKHRIPALATGVWDGNAAAVLVTGRRRMDLPAPVLERDPFHLGSNTKAMTATVIAKLVEEGRLRWDTRLREFMSVGVDESLGDLAEPFGIDPGYADVTLEMLLSHRAALPEEKEIGDDKFWSQFFKPGLDPMVGRRIYARAALRNPPKHAPGTKFQYRNAGYVIAGYLMERATGLPWEKLMQAMLFAPLGMEGCGFGPVVVGPWGHRFSGDATIPVRPGPLADNPPTMGPAGTVHCPLGSYLKFLRLHLDALNDKPALLSAASFAKLHQAAPVQGYTYGGWERMPLADGSFELWHAGSNTFNYALAVIRPAEGKAFVAVSNSYKPRGVAGVNEAMNLLAPPPRR